MQSDLPQQAARLSRLREYLVHDSSNLNLLSEVADLSLALGRLGDARAAIAEALSVAPGDRYFRSRLSSVALAEQNWTEAAELCRALLEEGEDHPAIRYNLGRALLFAGQYDQATIELQSVLGAQGVPDDVPQLLIRALHYAGDLARATEVAEQHLGAHPGDATVAGMLSLLQLDRGDFASARKWSDLSLSQSPENLDALLASGAAVLADGDSLTATTTFDRALQVNPSSGRAWGGRGLARLLDLDVPAARADFENAALFMPTHLGTWIALGWIQLMDQDPDAAAASFSEARARNRNFAENYAGLAAVAIAKGHFSEAKEQVDLAVRLDPRSVGAQLVRSLLLRSQGRKEAAQRLFDAGLGSQPVAGGGTLTEMIVRMAARNAVQKPLS